MSAGTAPAELLARARLAQEPGFRPAPLRDAATVTLLRDTEAGLEVYLLRRVRAMAFAAGMHVFPGGSVDPADAAADLAWTGPEPRWWADRFRTSEPLARALVCAAVRETFEEAGVLLAGRSPTDVLGDLSSSEWEAERASLEEREHSLSELLSRRHLVLRADLLRPMAHWITPEVEPRRFDTRFFLAAMPAGQICRAVGSEADERRWVRPADALDQQLPMLPPTAAVLRDLAAFDDVAGALRADRSFEPLLPKLVVDPTGRADFLLPGQPGYPD